jgi:tryptophan halogenase
MSNDQRNIKDIVIIGGGTAGWMSATYLLKSLGPDIRITVIESADHGPIGVGEATIPTIKTEFFDRLGIPEEEWMPKLGGTFKMGIKYANWRTPKEQGGDHYYHVFGEIPLIDEVPLSSIWVKNFLEGKTKKSFAQSCFSSSVAFDNNLSPRLMDGTKVQHYAYHFDAVLVSKFLNKWGVARGITHVVDRLTTAEQDEQGNVTCVVGVSGKKYHADFFVDCSGFAGFLIDKVFKEPLVSFGDYLLTDRAIAINLPENPERDGIRSYTTAAALKAGWVWEIPLYSRSGNGYVYSSQFTSDDEALKELREHFGKRADNMDVRPIKFQSRRHVRSWVKNCVCIGLASSFLEPLESSTIYFIYGALYQLVKCFPQKNIDPVLRDKYNHKINFMVDDNRDFIAMHFKTAQREDTAFWRANKYETKIPDSLKLILKKQKSGLPIKRPTVDNSNIYPTFKSLFQNFWTETNYQCILSGVGYMPNNPYPILNYRPDIMVAGEKMFADIEKRANELKKILPSHYEFLKMQFEKADIHVKDREEILADA